MGLRARGMVLVPFAIAAPLMLGASAGRTTATTVACDATLTASVTLTADLPCGGTDGLVIGANNVTVNLNGHTISGDGTHFGVLDAGGFTGLTVENGVINDFSVGVELFGGSGAKVLGSRIEDEASVGILDSSSDGARLSGDYVVGGGGTGVSLGATTGSSVTGSWIEGNAVSGISVNNDPRVTISGNKILDNTSDGIDLGGTTTGTITGNIVNDNGLDGISAGPTFTTVKPPVAIARNRASFNAQWGILAPNGVVVDGGGNVVQGNGKAGQCEGVVCDEVSN